VTVAYAENGTNLDQRCATLAKTAVEPAWIEEAARRRVEFRRMWDAEGPSYLKAALNEIGRDFPYRDMVATLTVCPIGASMSLPLLINLHPFLESTQTSPGPKWPLWYLPAVIFHEVMHNYTARVPATYELRRKYENEATRVKTHLLVMAVEKRVFGKLWSAEKMKWLDNDYRTNSGPAYKRAWEIVNDIEGAEPFIRELKRLRLQQPQ
jgi:hypothetical protein